MKRVAVLARTHASSLASSAAAAAQIKPPSTFANTAMYWGQLVLAALRRDGDQPVVAAVEAERDRRDQMRALQSGAAGGERNRPDHPRKSAGINGGR